MDKYPDAVRQQLDWARERGQYRIFQTDAISACFDILADYPQCTEASDLVYEIFCDEWMIYDQRCALQKSIEEWDDRPHQQRRRLAHSFAYLTRNPDFSDWEEIPYIDQESDMHQFESRVTMQYLSDGKEQLGEAYCLGDEEAAEYAWPRFMQAIENAHDPLYVERMIAKQYVELGYFADAVEVLLDLVSKHNTFSVRRMLVEVRWWRDNAYRIPWLPPPGDGSRHDRLIKMIDPNAKTQAELLAHFYATIKTPDRQPKWEPVITPELKKLFGDAIPTEIAAPAPNLVDWSFLDREDGSSTELADWVIELMHKLGKDMNSESERHNHFRLTRPIPPPTTPKREPPLDMYEDDEEELDEEYNPEATDDDDLWDDSELDDSAKPF